jgi:putative ABC transport system substrate-binding protein
VAAGLTLAILAAVVVADAQTTGLPVGIGVLAPGMPSTGAGLDAFRQGLRNLGYAEGRDVLLEVRWDEGRPELWAPQAAELVRLKVRVIVAGTTPTAEAARRATATIPIVMAAGPYAVELGLVQSLARPGGNVTGVSLFTQELAGKRLQILKETVPGVRRIAYFWISGPSAAVTAMNRDYETAARSLGLELAPIEAMRESTSLEVLFRDAVRAGADAVILAQGPFWARHRTRLANLALKYRLPMMSGETGAAEAGALLYYGSDIPESWRRAATYVDKILKGTKPADLPVEQPSKFELIVNLKTAKALGLAIPPAVLGRADEVIQ